MSDRPYSKVYHELADEYPAIYDGNDLAAYVRLLVAADQAWPSAARWAGYASKPEVQRLADAGLVLLDGNRYRIKGLDKERTARSNAARNAARIRHGTADSSAETMPHRAKQSRAEQSNGADGTESAIDAYYRLTTKPPSQNVISWLDRLTSEHPETTVLEVMASEWTKSPNPSDFLGRVQTRLAVIAKQWEEEKARRSKSRAIEEAEAARKRREQATPEELAQQDEWRAQIDGLVKEMG